MDADSLTKAHEDFVVAGYDSVSTKSHFFYITNIGHRIHVEPHDATQLASDLVDAGLANMAEDKARIQLTEAGREAARTIREQRARAQAWKLSPKDVVLVVLSFMFGLLAMYLAKKFGWV